MDDNIKDAIEAAGVDLSGIEYTGATRRPDEIGFVKSFDHGAVIIRNGVAMDFSSEPKSAVGTPLHDGDIIRNAGGGDVEVLMLDGSSLVVAPNSEEVASAHAPSFSAETMKGNFVAIGEAGALPAPSFSVPVRNDTNLAVTG